MDWQVFYLSHEIVEKTVSVEIVMVDLMHLYDVLQVLRRDKTVPDVATA
jgi:hypothetical protein